jgi:hypothetical protein
MDWKLESEPFCPNANVPPVMLTEPVWVAGASTVTRRPGAPKVNAKLPLPEIEPDRVALAVTDSVVFPLAEIGLELFPVIGAEASKIDPVTTLANRI